MAASAKAFLGAVRKAAPLQIRTILTDNGKEFTERLLCSRSRQPTGEHEFDQLCQSLGIEHPLTKPKIPQANNIGRKSQWMAQPGAALAPLQQCRGLGEDIAPVCMAVPTPFAAKDTGTCCPRASTQNLEDASAGVIRTKRAQSFGT